MRINRYVASASQLSRRAADEAVAQGRVMVNDILATTGQPVEAQDRVTLDATLLQPVTQFHYVLLHKPVGIVVSRRPQGNDHHVYELIPHELSRVNPVGRLDKDSSGLLLLSDDGEFVHRVSHPSAGKEKSYDITLNHPLSTLDAQRLAQGIQLTDGLSQPRLISIQANQITVGLIEGRNRQLRRTMAALGYEVTSLHRTAFGRLKLGTLSPGAFKLLSEAPVI